MAARTPRSTGSNRSIGWVPFALVAVVAEYIVRRNMSGRTSSRQLTKATAKVGSS